MPRSIITRVYSITPPKVGEVLHYGVDQYRITKVTKLYRNHWRVTAKIKDSVFSRITNFINTLLNKEP